MKSTNILQKALPSLINVLIVSVLSIPLFFFEGSLSEKKLTIIGIFLLYTLVFLIFNKNRDLGMVVARTFWKRDYPAWQHFIYNILYTASFATLLFWIRFPLDLFIANMIVQILMIIITGTTLHGFLSGKMVTVIK